VVPATRASFGDLQAIFGTPGQASRCQCQRYKLAPLEPFGSTPVEERTRPLEVQTSCGDLGDPETSGLVAYLDGVPVTTSHAIDEEHRCGLLTTFSTQGSRR